LLLAAPPFLLPGFFVGIGLIRLAALPGIGDVLYGSPLLVVLAGAARYGVLALGLALLAAATLPRAPVEAARLAGAGSLGAGRVAVLPGLRPALLAGTFLVYALAAGELAAVQLAAPPGCDTVPMRLFALIHYQYESKVAALALVQLALVFVPALVGAGIVWVAARLRRRAAALVAPAAPFAPEAA
ncbi:MAG: hypothetical protein HZA54_05790, partial [Planctomycetes bacterium]|nr:hypothetical protein [Planctomycetota bacterium]